MKTILMSIRPQWVHKIFTGQKTIELRKTAPEPPFRAVVYCTQSLPPWKKHLYVNQLDKRGDHRLMDWWTAKSDILGINAPPYDFNAFLAHGKVVGEFICEKTDKISVHNDIVYSAGNVFADKLKNMCLTVDELKDYLGDKNSGYAIGISSPKLYKKPKELSRLYTSLPDKILDSGDYDCRIDGDTICPDAPEGGDYCAECRFGGRKAVSRPPQSWQYIIDPEVCDG